MGYNTKNPEENTSKNTNILDSPVNAEKILKMTADTMFLFTKEGVCLDIILRTDRWFLQDPSYFIGKNIFDILPSETAIALRNNFNKVALTGITSSDNYEVQISKKNYFFKCIIYNYDEDLILCQYRDITQRILLKNRLEIMNQKLQEIEEVAQIGQWIYDTATKVFQYSGFSGALAVNDEVRQMSLDVYLQYIHPGDRAAFKYFVDKEMAYSGNQIVYRLILNKQTFHFRFRTISSCFKDGSKFISGYVQNVSDIMQKQHDLEIVTHAIEKSTDYIYSMKTNGQLVFGNRKYKECNGWNANEDITNYNFFKLQSRGAKRTKWLDIIQQLTSTNQTINFVETHPIPERPDIIAFDCTSYLIEDSNGDKLIWTFCKDITERVNYEKQVKELNQIMSTVLKNIPMSISVKDVKDSLKYIFSNRMGDDFHWGVKDEMIGKTDFEIYPEQTANDVRAEDLSTIKSNQETRKIIEDIDEYGEKQIRDQLRILVDDEIRPLLISIERDITKDKLMEQELIDAKEKAEQSDKLKSAFIANMSHEIRTPLNAIVGFSRIIAETEDLEERKSYYSIVEANNTRLLSLINEILDISKIESGIIEFDNEPMKVSMLFQDLLKTNSLRCPEGIKLVFDDSDPNLIIRCDKNRLAQVINNLIGNAIKFTKQGSINFGYFQYSDHINFYVKDTGAGIPNDQIDQVFERFIKADCFSQGTGLGLSICKSIVEKIGGTISVESTLGFGTCFNFCFPSRLIVKPLTNNITHSESITSDGTNRSGIILVAEDIDSNYLLLESMIGKTYTLKRAKNGLEAVNMFEELQPDLILMDTQMPVMNGLESVKIIRTLSSDVPIIAQSVYAHEEDQKESIENGCNDFLMKPFKKEQLLELIHKYLK